VARAALLFLVVASTAAAFVARLVIAALARRRWPRVAAGVERWWAWTPMVVVCLFAIWLIPPVGIAVTIGALIALRRADAIGSPFRPRH
jgi:hypothetical protein